MTVDLDRLRRRLTSAHREPPSSTCVIEGCERLHEASGLCKLHHKRLRQGTRLDAPIEQRRSGKRPAPAPNPWCQCARPIFEPITGSWLAMFEAAQCGDCGRAIRKQGGGVVSTRAEFDAVVAARQESP